MSDGPHDLRKQEKKKNSSGATIKSVCFPTGSALASSCDVNLFNEVGTLLGNEFRTENVQILLGKAVNIKRSPLCGRNCEYYSENPFLATNLAAAFIKGVQSKGVGTSIKHFVANNKETHRLSTDTIVSERVLYEIYLAAFEGAIKDQNHGPLCAHITKLTANTARKTAGF